MKCYYEVLQVNAEATDDDIKKSYRKLALQWHPDKNPERADEAKTQFQLIQQAYEVLIDPQERSWYDRHKDSILRGRGSDFKDDSVDIYPFFTSTCYSGFGDDVKGFYSVYGELFKRIAAEDIEFEDSDFEVPGFGQSTSSYDDVVHPFYAHWESYSTKKSFSWLDTYDLREAPNRRIAKLMEKDNKKIRDQAKKERNEEVRALVAFVRKRDKRVKAHLEYLEKRAEENARKTKEMRKKQIEKRKQEMDSYVECDWAKFSNLKGELEEIEAKLRTGSDDEPMSDDEANDPLYCVACNKVFKTEKAFSNHERSKKHKENVSSLRIEMEEDDALTHEGEKDDPDALSSDDTDGDRTPSPILTKKKKGKQKKPIFLPDSSDEDPAPVESEPEPASMHRAPVKTKKKKKEPKPTVPPPTVTDKAEGGDRAPVPSSCAVCRETFPSKNGLFKHLKSTGHAVPPDQVTTTKTAAKGKSRKS